ncbi:MAG: 1-deoxy-D-xylulose-5-phosphate reductoisomerase [Candidatus Lambdaproteobacteria bacterium]|nr:1-deoxy-D-xylulose-5-phosphate reductoisomerase [Candidatus Lambdaproteobacteria bacterium]
MKTLAILGATGSIGSNTLDVVRRNPGAFRVHALAARRNVARMLEQVLAFRPRVAVMFEPQAAAQLKAALGDRGETTVLSGMEGLLHAATDPAVEHVVCGIVGAIGLRPTYAAVERGKQVSVANKETLVLAGELMVRRARETGAVLLPMDSEHNAIFQCMNGAPPRHIQRIVLTASGGPFRELPEEDFARITREQALHHPNWRMGPKITIDSATMFNKGLEVIEARWLFNLPPERIDVLVHRQSIVHSMVEFIDGSVLAQLGLPDMRTPIACCLAYPERLPLDLPRLDLAQVGRLDFEPVSRRRFPALFLALRALELGGGAPAVLNGANEAAVAGYLDGGFSFLRIAAILKEVLADLETRLRGGEGPAYLRAVASVDDAIAADRWGRDRAEQLIAQATAS